VRGIIKEGLGGREKDGVGKIFIGEGREVGCGQWGCIGDAVKRSQKVGGGQGIRRVLGGSRLVTLLESEGEIRDGLEDEGKGAGEEDQ